MIKNKRVKSKKPLNSNELSGFEGFLLFDSKASVKAFFV
jgi:hypothetical protein